MARETVTVKHDELWEALALERLRQIHGELSKQQRGTFRRAFVRAVGRRADKPQGSPMGTVRTDHDRPRYEGSEFLATVWRALDGAMAEADAIHRTPHARPPHPAAVSIGGRHVIRALVPHSVTHDQYGHRREAVASMLDVTVREVAPGDAPVACHLPAPDGSTLDARIHQGAWLRPLATPEGWSGIGLADLARLAGGREPWVDNPFAPAPPQHRSVLPLEAVCAVVPASAIARRAAVATAASDADALGLCVIDGVVHVATPPPEVVTMAVTDGVPGRAADGTVSMVRTWRLGHVTGLTDMRTEARHRLVATPDAYLMVDATGRIPYRGVRGRHRPVAVGERCLPHLLRIAEDGVPLAIPSAVGIDVTRPDLMPASFAAPEVHALGSVLDEVARLYQADLVRPHAYVRPGSPERPPHLPSPARHVDLRRAVETVVEDAAERGTPGREALDDLSSGMSRYAEATDLHGTAGPLGVLAEVLRPAFRSAAAEVEAILAAEDDPDVSDLRL